jgi:hypothetical protein
MTVLNEVSEPSLLEYRELAFVNSKNEVVYPLAVAVSTGNHKLVKAIFRKLRNVNTNLGYELFTPDPDGDVKLKLSPL